MVLNNLFYHLVKTTFYLNRLTKHERKNIDKAKNIWRKVREKKKKNVINRNFFYYAILLFFEASIFA